MATYISTQNNTPPTKQKSKMSSGVRNAMLGTVAVSALLLTPAAQAQVTPTPTVNDDTLTVTTVDGGVVVDALAGNDSITFNATSVVGGTGIGTVTGGDGIDSFTFLTNSTGGAISTAIGSSATGMGEVSGGLGDDIFTLSNTRVGLNGVGIISGGDGADTISFDGLFDNHGIGINADSRGEIRGDAGDDMITLNRVFLGDDGVGIVSGGDDNDTIQLNGNGPTVGVIGRSAGSSGSVLGDDGDDTITLNAISVGQSGDGIVSGGNGDDIITLVNGGRTTTLGVNATSTGQVLGDDGNDTIELTGTIVGLYGAATVSGGNGDDDITLNYGSIAYGGGTSGSILGDAGADTITLNAVCSSYCFSEGAATISGGADDDTITLNNGTTLGNYYASNSGTVLGDGGDDTIILDDATIGRYGTGLVSGGDGEDNITLSNGTDLAANGGSSGTVQGDAGNDTVTVDSTISSGAGTALIDGGDDIDTFAFIVEPGVTTVFDGTSYTSGANVLAGSSIVRFEHFRKEGSGTFNATDALDFTLSTTLVDGVLDFSGNGATNSAAIDILNGTLITDGGAFAAGATATVTDGTLDINGDETITALVNNGGTVDIAAGATFSANTITNSSVVTNAGTITTTSPLDNLVGATLTSTGTINGGLNNAGTASIAGALNGAITNTSTLTITGNTTANGTLGNNSGGTVSVIGGDFTGITTFTNAADVSIDSGRTLSVASFLNAADGQVTNSGVLTSTSVIQNAIDGTLTSTGTINGGLNNAGTANIEGALNGDSVNDGIFNVTNNTTSDGAFTNNASRTLQVTDGDFTGITTFTNAGDVTVSAGRTLGTNNASLVGGSLLINGTITGDIISSDTFISGVGVFSNDFVANAGTIVSPGDGIFIGSLGVNGDLALNSGSQLIIDVAENMADTIDVVGAVTINDASLLLQDLAGAVAAQDTSLEYIIIDNDGTDSVVGNFATVVDNLAFLDPLVSVEGGDGNDVVLTFVQASSPVPPTPGPTPPTPVTIDLTTAGNTPNQLAAASGLNPVLATDPNGTVLTNAFLPLSFAQAESALDNLSGVQHTENNFEANQAGLHFTDTLSHIITSSLSGKDRDTLCRDGENKNVPVDEQACEQADRFHVFASGLYRQGSIDSDGLGKFRTESESIGALFGVGVRLTDRFHGGVALGFSNSDNSISQVNSSSTLSSFFASAYGYYQKGQIDANAIVGYATTNITTDRIIQIGTFSETATSDQDSNGFIAHLDTGYTVSYQTFDIRTSISAGYSSADREAFSETGGGLTNLNGTAQTDTLGDVALRFRAQKNYAIGGSFLTPYLGVGIQSLFGDVTPDATLSFQAGGPAFTVVGASLDRTRGLVETGARINASDNIDLFVSYDGAFAGNSREHRFGFGIAVTF